MKISDVLSLFAVVLSIVSLIFTYMQVSNVRNQLKSVCVTNSTLCEIYTGVFRG